MGYLRQDGAEDVPNSAKFYPAGQKVQTTLTKITTMHVTTESRSRTPFQRELVLEFL